MNSKVDGEIDLRHRALGALVLVLLGIVVLPIILNGASMTPEVVNINSANGQKAPRTFETNIRPVDKDASLVTVESESPDRLKAEVRFNQNEDQTSEKSDSKSDSIGSADTASDSRRDQPLIAENAPAVHGGSPIATSDAIKSNANSNASGVSASATPPADDGVIEPLPPISDAETSASEKAQSKIAGDESAFPSGDNKPTQEEIVVARTTDIGSNSAVTTDAGASKSDDVNNVKDAEPLKQTSVVVANTAPPVVDESDGSDKQTLPAASLDSGWVVRVGTFGRAENASRLVEILKTSGFDGRSSLSKTKSGKTLTRVWVGPFADRKVASRELTRIERSTGEKGFVTAYP